MRYRAAVKQIATFLVNVGVLVSIIAIWSQPAPRAYADTIDVVANQAAPFIYMVDTVDPRSGTSLLGTAYPIHSYPHIGTFWATDAHVIGTAITDTLVLENSHLFAPWTGARVKIRSVSLITQDDTAVIETSYMRGVKPLSFSQAPVTEGDTVVHLGYGGQDDSRQGPLYTVGSVDYFQDADVETWTINDAIYSTDSSTHGDSGGPLLDARGHVVGMIDASLTDGTDAISIPEQTVVNDTSSMIVSMLDQQLR